ncbi:LOW QUALITY PROTEIN: hypothetical protein IFM46972_01623 [Aspergillus udagawae]|uniref:Uncharacterized protein n=1 Tax=Aspergillus udagawae TaxID=91492 RepID=A0A8H3RIT9_9EURO|nr:LOW QUALITY PROTEIN: hypothetical protein IFM46972_01623 [Aspergillus udagawae]
MKNILEILPIRQIQKRSRIQISSLKSTLHLRLDSIPLLVLPPEEKAKYGDKNDLDQMRDDHGPDAEGWSATKSEGGNSSEN